MKPGNEIRFGGSKHSQVMVQLSGVGGVFGIISWFIAVPAKYWVEAISALSFVAALAVFLAAIIADRKEQESKRNRKLE